MLSIRLLILLIPLLPQSCRSFIAPATSRTVPIAMELKSRASHLRTSKKEPKAATKTNHSFPDFPLKIKVDRDLLKIVKQKGQKLVGSIDQGTSSTRFIVFTQEAKLLGSAQVEHKQYFPSGQNKVGWHEHDGLEIWYRTKACLEALVEKLASLDLDLRQDNNHHWHLEGIGITNQRETTLAWNAETGKPYYNAIVWDDVRTSSIARSLARGYGIDRFRKQTGLPLASYFAGTKVKWLIDNVPELEKDLKDETKRQHVRFGTIDTWLVYQLTGKKSSEATNGLSNVGGIHVTDVTNASRWLFLDLKKVQWDSNLIRLICGMDIPLQCLPEIRPSSCKYGIVSSAVPSLEGAPLSAILGDQQSSLFAQCAHKAGEAKNTYGTGAFLLLHTGDKIVPSKTGLLTTIAFQGEGGQVNYALEGSVSHCGSTLQWLRDQLNIVSEAKEADLLASQTDSNDGLYFVPAFSGLFAPFWRSDARGCIVGMTATHHKGHICRAALESTAYQAREVFDAMYADSNVVLRSLRVDGGGTQSSLLMQFQADMLEVPVEKPLIMETTALGAAFAAGLATGVWKDVDDIRRYWQVSRTFYPKMDPKDRDRYWLGWKKAVERSLGWVEPEALSGSIRKRTGFARLRYKLNRTRRRFQIKLLRTSRRLLHKTSSSGH